MSVLCMAGLDREIKALRKRLERSGLAPEERLQLEQRIDQAQRRLAMLIRNFGGRPLSAVEPKVRSSKRKGIR